MRDQQDDKVSAPVKLSNILKGIWELSFSINNA